MPQNVAQFGMMLLLLLLVVGRLMIYAAFRGQEPETAKTSGCFRKPVAISGPFVLPQLLQTAANCCNYSRLQAALIA